MRSAAWGWLLAVACANCGGSQSHAQTSSESVPSGDLAPAVPASSASSDRGDTGHLARVVLGGRRQRVADLFTRYLQAVAAHDLAAIGPLFDAVVFDASESGEAYTREQIVARHERLFGISDTSMLADAIPRLHPVVESASELRRNGRQLPSGMHADDWVIIAPLQMPPGVMLPRELIVRWVGETPVITGVLDRRMR